VLLGALIGADPGAGGAVTGRGQPRQLCWIALGMRMGYTVDAPQRELILAAVARMSWTDQADAVPYLSGAAVRAILTTLFGHRHRTLRRVGVAQLNGAQLLIGLEHRTGERAYLLDLDSEAIYVLTDTPQPRVQPFGRPLHRVA
jgi:hypothetical protein